MELIKGSKKKKKKGKKEKKLKLTSNKAKSKSEQNKARCVKNGIEREGFKANFLVKKGQHEWITSPNSPKLFVVIVLGVFLVNT